MSKSGSKLSQQLNVTYKLGFYYAFLQQIYSYSGKPNIKTKHQNLIILHPSRRIVPGKCIRIWLGSFKAHYSSIYVVTLMKVIWNEYVQKLNVLHGKCRRFIWPHVDRCNLSRKRRLFPMHLKSNFLFKSFTWQMNYA